MTQDFKNGMITGLALKGGLTISGGGGGEIKVKYSLEELVVGEWLDGRPLYQKTMIVPIDHTKNTVTYNHGISNLGQVISYSGFMLELDNGIIYNRFIPQFYYTGDTDYNVSLYSVNKDNMLLTYGDWLKRMVPSLTEVYITVRYTKESGIPMVTEA